MSGPRVIIGAPVYNHAGEAREAFESILGQTCRDFALVVVDDCSTDGTFEIAQHYAALDPRVTCRRNERRVGMIENWRRAFHQALAAHPGAEYFAWASDHDLWHPRWLSVLAGELDRHPEAVLAYPLNTKVYADGGPVDRKPWYFDTQGVSDVGTRLRRTGWDMSAGNMIYGLFRITPLVQAGVFRRVLVPDRLLLSELSLYGEFRQVREVLWFRRWYGRVFSLSRQRASFFPSGRPFYAYLPWWLSHTVAFSWNLIVRGAGRPAIGRLAGVRLSLAYVAIALPLHAIQQARALRLYVVERTPALRGKMRRVTHAVRTLPRAGSQWVARWGRRVARRLGRVRDEAIRIPGVALLRALRAIPVVRSRVIPWLMREEIQQVPATSAVARLKKTLGAVASGEAPVLVGPWLSEVGFELLYWIPFLNWAAREYGLKPERLIALTRGGAGCWYRDLCARSIDLFDLMTVEDYRRRNEERWSGGGNQKQYEMSELDHEIVDLAKAKLGEKDLTILHPSVMYRLLRFYWFEKGAVSLLREHTLFRRLPAVEPPPADLPNDYVAVRFYFRPSFPDTPANRDFIASALRGLARSVPVVVLNTGLTMDDHVDFEPPSASGVYRVDRLMTPTRNLETQTRIIAHARGLVGTYGGLSYLGPFYGVPAVGVYSHASELVVTHLDTTERVCRALDAPLVTLNVKAGELVGMVFEDLVRRSGRSGIGTSAVAG